MIIEVIAYSVADALAAQQGGADRIELVSGMLEGGLTPSYSLIKEVLKAVSIPVQVMLRPHSHSFRYSPKDLNGMLHDLEKIQELKAHGVVFGLLNQEGGIDVDGLELLLKHVEGLDITFHRAFDEVRNQQQALQMLARYPQIRRILTSGKAKTAFEGAIQIKSLVTVAKPHALTIMPGSGLKASGLLDFVKRTAASEFHFGQGVRHDGILSSISPDKIKEVKSILMSMPKKGESYCE